MVKVQLYFNNGDFEFTSKMFEFPVLPQRDHVFHMIFFTDGQPVFEQSGIMHSNFKPHNYVWLYEDAHGVYVEIEIVPAEDD
ncbi:hypothetical protein [Flavobacterium lindanitolerans]|uniref:hypothetical protein n=1 Tax=Flavobacterium lindanitolerans TaxID=428988 RepID=UPI0027BAE433|nr:hypothetical protein [Flavobacterium lindanitolerans]